MGVRVGLHRVEPVVVGRERRARRVLVLRVEQVVLVLLGLKPGREVAGLEAVHLGQHWRRKTCWTLTDSSPSHTRDVALFIQ